jgi:hypothetical protein
MPQLPSRTLAIEKPHAFERKCNFTVKKIGKRFPDVISIKLMANLFKFLLGNRTNRRL